MAEDNLETSQYEEPTESDKELANWVVSHTDKWRDYRDQNYLDSWLEYERIFRGQWAAEDKTRDSERSRIISPATQQAIETRHAEIMEAIFGQGEWFDIEDDIKDVNGTAIDVEQLKAQLMEDFNRDKIKKAIDQIELMAEIYGTGIGEIAIKTEKEYAPSTQAIPGVQGQAAIGVTESDRISVKLVPVNPKNFLVDPNATSLDDAMGCAIEKFVSVHQIVKGMESGIYRKIDLGTDGPDDDLEATEEISSYQDERVRLLTYYGLVPKEYLDQLENEEEIADLFPEDSLADDYAELVEAIIVIANGNKLLKAEANPYMMKDRPVMLYQDDTVPGRVWGRGTAEKAYNMQKAIDGSLRMDSDARALTAVPMMAMDATRLPRGAKFEVRPGKAFLVNGDPTQIMMPLRFGAPDTSSVMASQNYERLLLQATGTVDGAGMPSAVARDGGGGMSMAMAGIIKKYKRTLSNFQEDFLIPFINKAAWRYMQFDPERYPSVDVKFIPTATLGILAREFEQQQFIALLQTLGPDTPVLPLILKGIVQNSSLSNRMELIGTLDKMSQPNPEAQQQQQMQQQAVMAKMQADLGLLQAQIQKTNAEAQQTMTETQLMPEEMRVKMVQSAATNLDNGGDFEKRLKLADMMLREKQINLKAEDTASNERIAALQMANKQPK